MLTHKEFYLTDHLRLVKDTAARSIQIWWKYTKLIEKGRNLKGPKAYYRVKVTSTRSKLYSTILKWRTLKGRKGIVSLLSDSAFIFLKTMYIWCLILKKPYSEISYRKVGTSLMPCYCIISFITLVSQCFTLLNQ